MRNQILLSIIFTSLLALLLVTDPGHAASSLSGCVNGQMVTQNGVTGPLVCIKGANVTPSSRMVNIATTGDVGAIGIPTGITKYQLVAVQVTNCTVTPVLAQMNVNTLAAGAGTSLVDNATLTGAVGAGIILPRTLTTIAQTNALIATTLFVNMGVANADPGTCDVYATIRDLT